MYTERLKILLCLATVFFTVISCNGEYFFYFYKLSDFYITGFARLMLNAIYTKQIT